MEAKYLIQGMPYRVSDIGFEKSLISAYENKKRPLCQCTTPSPEMYIAKINGKYILKRMPDTGGQHSSNCESYDIPIELSGLGQIAGTAIQENLEDGQTTLKLAFSLSKGSARVMPEATGIEHDSVVTDGNKLSLRGTLHYLWEQAGFSKWSPAMKNKRNWYVIRKYLLEAANNTSTKGKDFASILYIPESFTVDKKDEIVSNRIKALSPLTNNTKANRPLMVIIGEVKSIEKATFNYKMILKHLPDFNIILNEDIYQRLMKRFTAEIELVSVNDKAHLIAIGTFGISNSGTASFEEVALMTVDENWLPFDNRYEFELISELVKKNVRFIKCLRYNLPSSTPLATALVTQENHENVALFIKPAAAKESFNLDLNALLENSETKSWVWNAGSESLINLPINEFKQG